MTFTVIGHLELPASWERFGERVIQQPFVPYLKLLELTSQFDVNLAPLVRDDPFCEAKSELKIFEAGVVAVPTIASATRSYAHAIDDGVDGFLVHDSRSGSRTRCAV